MKLSVFSYFVLFLPLLAQANKSNDELQIAVGEMPYLFSSDKNKQGSYNRFFDLMKRQMNLPFTLVYSPPARAEQEYASNRADCITPGDIANMPNKAKFIASLPYHYAKAYIYTRADQVVISSLTQLQNKVVATRRGFSYGGFKFDTKVNLISVSKNKQSLEMLSKGRVDAFIAYEPDILHLLKTSKNTFFHKDPAFVLHQQPEKLVCHRSKQSLQFIEQFDTTLQQLQKSGQLQTVLTKQ